MSNVTVKQIASGTAKCDHCGAPFREALGPEECKLLAKTARESGHCWYKCKRCNTAGSHVVLGT